jgi:hypothetical protein
MILVKVGGVYTMRSARAAMTVAGKACAKKDAKSDMI